MQLHHKQYSPGHDKAGICEFAENRKVRPLLQDSQYSQHDDQRNDLSNFDTQIKGKDVQQHVAVFCYWQLLQTGGQAKSMYKAE